MKIELLKIEDYSKCNNIWNMKKQSNLAEQFLDELKSGNRVTCICKDGDEFVEKLPDGYKTPIGESGVIAAFNEDGTLSYFNEIV